MVDPGGWGACVVDPRGVCVVARGGAWFLPGGVCMVALGEVAWDMTRYADTVNERAVRILLECILVAYYCYPGYAIETPLVLVILFHHP